MLCDLTVKQLHANEDYRKDTTPELLSHIVPYFGDTEYPVSFQFLFPILIPDKN